MHSLAPAPYKHRHDVCWIDIAIRFTAKLTPIPTTIIVPVVVV